MVRRMKVQVSVDTRDSRVMGTGTIIEDEYDDEEDETRERDATNTRERLFDDRVCIIEYKCGE